MQNTLLRMSSLMVVAFVAAAVSACSKDEATSSTPVAPTPPPTPSITAVTVTGLDAVRTGFFSDYAASATLSDGTSQNVTGTVTWTSSNAGAATMDASGRLTGRTHGNTTVTATYQGRTGSKAVNIVNYGGTWTGAYTPSRRSRCPSPGAAVSWEPDGRLILSCDAQGTSSGVTFRFQLGG